MQAAVVRSFGSPPRYEAFETPTPAGENLLLDVVAAGLHPRVRSQASGSHYSSTGELPLIPGVDGVGRTTDGELRYFLLEETSRGSMAEKVVVDPRRTVRLPADADPLLIAAAMNPGMSSWVALRKRIEFEPGSSVLVLGATGSSGRLAVQVAKHLGAGRVVAAGRDAGRLASLSGLADEVVSLAGTPAEVGARLAAAASDIDVVLDYVWGPSTAAAMIAIVSNRTDAAKPLTWVEIGSVGGPTADIPSAALRAVRLQIVGSGQGSVPTRDIVAELEELARELTVGGYQVDVRPVPLAEVETAWTAPFGGDERIVFVP